MSTFDLNINKCEIKEELLGPEEKDENLFGTSSLLPCPSPPHTRQDQDDPLPLTNGEVHEEEMNVTCGEPSKSQTLRRGSRRRKGGEVPDESSREVKQFKSCARPKNPSSSSRLTKKGGTPKTTKNSAQRKITKRPELTKQNERRPKNQAEESSAKKKEPERKRKRAKPSEESKQRKRDRRRERLANETPAEKEERIRKRREERLQKFEQKTEAEKEEFLKRTRFLQRQRRAAKRQRRPNETEEEKDARLREMASSKFFAWEAKKATLPQEEAEQAEFQQKMKRYMAYLAYKAKFRPEEWKEKEKMRHKFSTFSVEKKMRVTKRNKAYMKRLPEEMRKKYRKTAWTNYINKLKQTNPAKWEQIYERNRKRVAEETPEERHRRLLGYKVYQAKRKAKIQLEEEGILTKEEIERRLEEVVRQVEEKDRLKRERKPVDPAEYRPRENARKPRKNKKCVDKEDRNYRQEELHSSSSLLPKEQNPPKQECALSFSSREDEESLKIQSELVPISPHQGESILEEEASFSDEAEPVDHDDYDGGALETENLSEVDSFAGSRSIASLEASPCPSPLPSQQNYKDLLIEIKVESSPPQLPYPSQKTTEKICPENTTTPPHPPAEKKTSNRGYINLHENKKKKDLPKEPSHPSTTSGSPFICEHCGKKYTQKANCEAHVKKAHLGELIVCNVCGKEEQTQSKLWRHKMAKHPELDTPPPEGLIICQYCSESVLRSLPHHVKKFHPEKHEEFMQSGLHRLSKSNRETKIKCVECEKEIRLDSVKRHMRNVHGQGSKAFPCQHCGKEFKENYHLSEHLRVVHTLESFGRNVAGLKLIKEISGEEGETLLLCSLCDEKLIQRKDIGGHLLSAHSDVFEKLKNGSDLWNSGSSWKCVECTDEEKMFEKEQLFYSHVKSCHPKKTKYCSQLNCQKLFPSQNSLRIHHDKEHPLAKFRNPLHFEDGDGAYRRPRMSCESCNTIFFRKCKLLEHVKNVHPETYWPCPHCQMLFYSEEQLNETHLASCFKNTDRQRRKRKGSNGKRGRGRHQKLPEKSCENDETASEQSENSGNEDETLLIKTEPDFPIGTRSSSRIKGEPKNKIFRLNSKLKTATPDDIKLKKEVKVLLTKLTKEQIDSYSYASRLVEIKSEKY